MTLVWYKDKAYRVIHDYSNGMIEIEEVNAFVRKVELVNKKDVNILIDPEDATK